LIEQAGGQAGTDPEVHMRLPLLAAAACYGVLCLSQPGQAAITITAAPTEMAVAVQPVAHYWHGRYYRYRWHGGYYAHRRWWHGTWRYY
jgi:hypothetical protein